MLSPSGTSVETDESSVIVSCTVSDAVNDTVRGCSTVNDFPLVPSHVRLHVSSPLCLSNGDPGGY